MEGLKSTTLQVLPCWKLPSPFQSVFSRHSRRYTPFAIKSFNRSYHTISHTRKSLFENTTCLLVREFLVLNQSNQWPDFHRSTRFLYKQFLNYCFLKSARELHNNYDTASVTSTEKSISWGSWICMYYNYLL